MDSLSVSLRVVSPLFLLMVIGYLLRRLKLYDDHTIEQMNTVVFKLLLPAMLCNNIYTCDLGQDLNPRLIATALLLSLACLAVTWAAAALIEKDTPRRAALAQGMFRNNYILYGIPIATAVYGEGCAGAMAILLACVIPFNNVLTVFQLTCITNEKFQPGKILRDVLTNPFVVSSALGFALLVSGIKLPEIAEKTLSDLAKTATPVSLLLLGGAFSIKASGIYRKQIVIGVVGKLLALPALFLPPIVLGLGLHGQNLLFMLIMLATPVASTSHIMARNMGADDALAGQLIVFGSAFSVLTLFFWIFLLRSLSLI